MDRLFNGATRQMSFAAATADYIGNEGIEVPVFERTILDNTAKRGVLLQHVSAKPATGQPTRYFERVPHDSKHMWIDPRNIDHNLDTKVKEVERYATITAMVDGITFTKFDKEVYAQQGSLFGDLQAQRMEEMITDMLDAQDQAVWTGGAKSLDDTTSHEYCSLLTQITKKGTIAADVRLTKGIANNVAALVNDARKNHYKARPTAVYMNAVDLAKLTSQEVDASDKIKIYDTEVVAGVKVPSIMTAAGIMPLIADPYCPEGKIAILDENLIERQYVASSVPRIYQLGTEKSLAERYIAVLFDTFIVKGADYGHMIVDIASDSTKA